MPGPPLASARARLAKSSSTSCRRRSKSLVSIARTKVSTTAAMDIGGAFDRRQREIDGAFAAGRQNPLEAEPHCGRIAAQREFDGLTRQRLRLAREQRRGGRGRLVAGAGPAARRFARPPRTRPGGFGEASSAIATSFCPSNAGDGRIIQC